MQRRTFIKNTTLCAVVVSATGFIWFDGKKFTGDCATTTDILGPFYRPDAPLRTNLLLPNAPGEIVELSGIVKHSDCKTPLNNALIEIWHCDANGQYDNTSSEFRYRGRTFSNEQGRYQFRTIIPVPYNIGGGTVRPAHYHLMISASGYQSLITQIYFAGDPNLNKDSRSASPQAKNRILQVRKKTGGENSLVFDIVMGDKLQPEPAALERLTGFYVEKDGSPVLEFVLHHHQLCLKDGNQKMVPLEYAGNNLFLLGSTGYRYYFELKMDGSVVVTNNTAGSHGSQAVKAG